MTSKEGHTAGPDAYQHRFRSGMNMAGDWLPWRDGLRSEHFGQPYYQERELVARTPPTDAAPELLAALVDLASLIERMAALHPSRDLREVLPDPAGLAHRIRAALSKAEGGAS